MLTLILPAIEYWDAEHEVFVNSAEFVLQLEHSLVSLSKWEALFEKPFLDGKKKTTLEMFGYIKAMCLTPELPENTLERLSNAQMQEIIEYLEKKHTATWFNETQPSAQNESTITAELIYYWMNALNIPIELENWNLHRLFVLIRIHTVKNSKPKPMGKGEAAARQREMNARRRAEMNTKG